MIKQSAQTDPIKHRIGKQARRWFVRLESGDLTAVEEEQFRQWLDKSPAHHRAFLNVDDFCQGLTGLEQLTALDTYTDKQVAGKIDRGRPSIWFRLFGDSLRVRWQTVGIAVASLIALAIGLSLYLKPDIATIDYATKVAEIQELPLEDGSNISLGARSQISIQYSENERKVLLLNGEAFFSVVPDADRPFVVQVDDAKIRVVGTRFNVRTSTGQLDVSVAEGVVKVTKPGPSLIPLWGEWRPRERELVAAQQVVVERKQYGEISEIISVDSTHPGSWRSGQLVYRNAQLREMIEDARRYTDQEILFADNRLGDLTLTVSFRAEQIDNMLNALPELLPVSVERAVPGRVVIKKSEVGGQKSEAKTQTH